MKRKALKTGNAPLLYNLFPRYFHSIDEWRFAVDHARDMGFNWIYINPFQETGFSGSQYAIRDYYRINPLFLKRGQDPSDWRLLKKFIESCAKLECNVMMDLVINHTAFDSILVQSNPLWFKRDEQGGLVNPRAIDPANADNVTVWGDLAEIDNRDSKDRQGLWRYWDKLIEFFQRLGVGGFRCDAAYQVPSQLWSFLIGNAKQRFPGTVFLAETLGCRLEEIDQLKGTGFDYLYNSSKYWEFDQPWCIEQHERNKQVAPSISFPESHDTSRLASEPPGTTEVQKCKYLFASVFSKGLLMTMGFEYGAKNKMDVVRGGLQDVEPPRYDLTKWITGINKFKCAVPVLCEEGTWEALSPYQGDILFLAKRSDEKQGKAVFCINKSKHNGRIVRREEIPDGIDDSATIVRLFSDTKGLIGRKLLRRASFDLGPAEIVLLCVDAVKSA